MAKLTDKQELFAREYLKDLNATQAAIRAGYSEKSAAAQGCENLIKPNVAERIIELKKERNDEVGIDASYVLRRLVEIDQMDAADILDDEGNMLPVSSWPKVWRTSLSGMDINRLKMAGKSDDDDSEFETTIQKIKWPDKVKNLELLGKHVTVQAFKENVKTEQSGTVQVVNYTPADYAAAQSQLEEKLDGLD
ncbi:terminase small subunit [Pantoea vagans]|uniref:terminase small subunit n=1 Tax=Pantoea vagans TaxID=470934 RepID=UPI00301A891D